MTAEMIIKKTIVLFSVIAVTLSCSPVLPDKESLLDPPPPGMKKIASKGKLFSQGWNDTLASMDEKPGMKSCFTYDYWIDSTEVTQKDFYGLTGRKPVADTSAFGVGENYPVYNVSWFDAVLYCNRRSINENIDTVYSYSGVKMLTNGNVYELVGLRNDFTRDGYRLPTESEWEFAARDGSSAVPFNRESDTTAARNFGWFDVNSSGMAHQVAAKKPNGFGLYDLVGNVYEWTNDWKGSYTGQNIVNSAGTFKPNVSFEKVIKGGSYNYGVRNLRPSYRSATYPTTLSSANEYVGFRCVRGIIPDAGYIDTKPQAPITNAVTIPVGIGTMRSVLGSSKSKIVFVNVSGQYRTLCSVDFSRTFPVNQEFLDDSNVFLPTISPDGRYVAYCSRNEGLSGPSHVSIRSLDSLNSPLVKLGPDSAYVPRWWINPLNGDTCIVYTNSAVVNSSSLWKSTKTYVQKISEGQPVGAPQVVITDGSYHDGISADGRLIVTSYSSLMMRNLQTSEERQLFVSPNNGKNANGSTQVCNTSMAPDSSGRCLFLDFGYSGTSTVVGKSYGIHQVLFVADFNDSILNAIVCPSNEESWDYPEWSNQSRFAVSCCRNSAGRSHSMYAVDLFQNTVSLVVTGYEMEQPYLWIGDISFGNDGFALDSFGQYNDPPISSYQSQLASKMLLFWQNADSLEVLVTGSSQAMHGIDPQFFTGGNALNLSAAGGDLLGQKHVILDYIIRHSAKTKAIISSLDPGWLGNPEGNFSWKAGLGQSKGFKYDSSRNYWEGHRSDGFRNAIKQVVVPFPAVNEYLGFNPSYCSGWGDSVPKCVYPMEWSVNNGFFIENIATIKLISDSLKSKGIHWFMINFPVSPFYQKTAAYGLWGPSWQTAHDIFKQLKEIEDSNPYFHFYDANRDGQHDYDESEAQDENHLCPKGAEKLTMRVDSLINIYLQRK